MMLLACHPGALYTADSGSKLAVQPVRLVRLLNSVYGSEHLLLFGREEECLYAQLAIHPPTARLHPQRMHITFDAPRLPLAAQA